MRRTPVTVVILAWNAWETTRTCLEALRPTLGPKDQVVVVDNGSTDATPRKLGGYGWVDVVTNDENHGFARGCNDGAAASRGEIVVFLNNDTVPLGRWLDSLVAPLEEDPTVGAVGPCSNFVSGPQIAEGAAYVDRAGMRRFAREWSSQNKGQLEEVPRLVGFCLAVRRHDFEEIGGFDTGFGIGGYEDDDLCARLTRAGLRLVIAKESFVHHEGHKTFDVNGLDWYAVQQSNRSRFEQRFSGRSTDRDFPLVSACLITKDEVANIEECLRSLEGLADEIVVHDTGSRDDTVAIARRLGATVIEGTWEDDFSSARNKALEHCRGEWIAWLDADETLQCDDVASLRLILQTTDTQLDGYSVAIDNLVGTGVEAGFVHSACRFFRRARCEWTGRLHEQIAGRGDHRAVRQAELVGARIRHTGYLDAAMRAKDKAARNLRVAEAEVAAADSWDAGFSLTSLGRSYLTAGQFEEAFERCREASERTDNRVALRLAMSTGAEALLGLGRTDEALDWIERLYRLSPGNVRGAVIESRIRLSRAEYSEALALIESVAGAKDEDGFEQTTSMLASSRAQALAGLGRYPEASDVLLETLDHEGVLDAHLGVLFGYMRRAERPLTELARRIPADKANVFLAQVLQLPDDDADACLEACTASAEMQQTPVLAAAATLARRLSVERALVWSARLRECGHEEACPLIAIATTRESSVERARAAAAAVGAFNDQRAVAAFAAALTDAKGDERSAIEAEAAALCPALAPVVEATPQQPVSESFRPSAQGSVLQTNDGPVISIDATASTVIQAGTAIQTSTVVQTSTAIQSGIGVAEGVSPKNHALSAPRVSIVVPCFNRAELTVQCLQSLSSTTSRDLYEVVLVDNGSSDATRELAGIEDERFKVLRNEENTGFGPACNQGATAARGELLLFLNNDTVLVDGWLEPLVAAMDEDEALGAVQPKLLYPDGRLNDAGGLVFGGGEPWVYGKGSPDPNAPLFTSRRAPDYASGACLMVRRCAFEEVSGFDDRYAPAYFEDADLSFALRDAGWKILYEPASTVIHVEGGTAGTDITKGFKQYQQRNAGRFAEKWASELLTRPPRSRTGVDQWAHRPQGGFGPGENLEVRGPRAWEHASTSANRAKSVLVIDPAMPVFDRAAGSLRMFHLLRTLRESGHAVTFYAIGGGDRRYADEVGRVGVTCYGGEEQLASSPSYATTYFPPLEGLFAEREFDVVIVTPWTTAELAVGIVRRCAPKSTLVIDTCDVNFVRLERAAELSGESADRLRAIEVRRRELAVYGRSDRLVFVTEQDRDAVVRELGEVETMVLPVVYERVDTGPGFEDRSGCVFVGNFLHPPNADAVSWWRAEIGARLARVADSVELTIVGNDPNRLATSLAGPHMKAIGAVASTLPYLHKARVSVAPLRYGAGMKGKVIEALAAGVPVVSTTVGIEGTGLVDGEHVLVADDPESFARAVERLHRDPELWAQMSDAGNAYVTEHFGLDTMRLGVTELVSPTRAPRSLAAIG
ncbi:MAG TPA: glycosyltransferase [Acidimicrobiales bacterium]|nr:glycosyltransferase [Acidimicrobiales bacterium]